MTKPKSGRPSTVKDGASRNIYLPKGHQDYVEALADRDFVSFSAMVRILISQHMRTAGVTS